MEETKWDEHESYGMVGISRITGGGKRRLFGSPLRDHHGVVRLLIQEAKRCHDLHEDRHHTTRRLIEIEMTSNQFAELITTLNIGDGVPCTVRYVKGDTERREDPPDEQIESDRVRDSFEASLKTMVDRMGNALAKVKGILDGGMVSKKAMREMYDAMWKSEQDLRSNLPFVLGQFDEATERIVASAKAEIDATVTHAVQLTGLEELKRTRLALNGPKALKASEDK